MTARALLKIGFTGFTVNITDRRIPARDARKMGFAADQLDSVCISFDKMDKIGADGVKAEADREGFAAEAVGSAGATSCARAISAWTPSPPGSTTRR